MRRKIAATLCKCLQRLTYTPTLLTQVITPQLGASTGADPAGADAPATRTLRRRAARGGADSTKCGVLSPADWHRPSVHRPMRAVHVVLLVDGKARVVLAARVSHADFSTRN
jgi:hypothetical protein